MQNGKKILLFGGINRSSVGGGDFNDLHLLDLKMVPLSMQRLTTAGDPPPRCNNTILTALSVSGRPGADREVMVMFGGTQGFSAHNSLYILQSDDSVSISDAASQPMVGRCTATVSKAKLKPRLISEFWLKTKM